MSKVIVTGGAGFIGSHLVDRLLRDGHEVIVLDNLVTGKQENVNPKARFVNCNIAEYEKILPYFKEVDIVFHCAALARIQPSVVDPLLAHTYNVTGTLNVLWAAYQAGAKKVIYSASSSVYGDQDLLMYPLKETLETHPTSPYAMQKLMGEQYCRLFSKLYALPTVMLRYFNVYGQRQITQGVYATVVGIFLKQRQSGQPMTIVGTGEKRRDFTHVFDVVQANILAWTHDVGPGEVINIGAGKNYSVNEVASLIGGKTVNIPDRAGEYQITLADTRKAKRLLGWQSTISFEEGLTELKKLHGL